jgi:hypothetical protein
MQNPLKQRVAQQTGAPEDAAPDSLSSTGWPNALRTTSAWVLRIPASQSAMAMCTVLTLVIYLWNMPHALDYPEYDEAAYFYRGYLLSLGNWKAADITNPNGSPVSVVFYAAWYLILRRPLLYP